MKKTLFSILAAAMVLSGTTLSCRLEQEDFFDRSASERMSDMLNLARNTLTSAPNGWRMECFLANSLGEFGGYVFTTEFGLDGSVTVRSEMVPDSTETSFYKLTSDDGPVLSFDTYNGLFHVFATPNSSDYEALGGDVDFVILSVTDSLVVLRGKRSGMTSKLYALDEKPEDYMKSIVSYVLSCPYHAFSGFLGKASVKGELDYVNRQISFQYTSDGEAMEDVLSYVYTTDGIRLYKPYELGGAVIQNLKLDVNTLNITEPGVSMALSLDPLPATYVPFANYAGKYDFTFKGGDDGKLTVTIPVELVVETVNQYYRMEGLGDYLTIYMSYDFREGCVTMFPSILGITERNNYIIMLGIKTDGYLTTSSEGAFNAIWNGNTANPTYNFKYNGYERWTLDNFVLLEITEDWEIYDADPNEAWYQIDDKYKLAGQQYIKPVSLKKIVEE